MNCLASAVQLRPGSQAARWTVMTLGNRQPLEQRAATNHGDDELVVHHGIGLSPFVLALGCVA